MPDGANISTIAITGIIGAAAGSLGTVVIQRLLPAPSPGDGFSLRWLSKEGTERRLEFGENEKEALMEAIQLKGRFPDVQVIEVRQGIVTDVRRAGVKIA